MAEGSIKERRARRRKRRKEAREEVNEEVEETEKGITAKKGYATPSSRRGEEATGIQSNNPIVRGFRRVFEYFDGVRSELEKVTWPTREETIRLTWIVSGVTVASALFLGGLSILFTEVFNLGVDAPWVFIGVFVFFLGLLYAYSWYINRSTGSV
ncbi:MAG: preprotein translocase subunit SecE [Chloroflexota bacterium]